MTATLTVEQVLAKMWAQARARRATADREDTARYWETVENTIHNVYYMLLSYQAIPEPDEDEIGLDAVKFPPSEEEWY